MGSSFTGNEKANPIPSGISHKANFSFTGANATVCEKSTCFNMTKAEYTVHVISDCVTSYDLKKMPEMLSYYAEKGCEVKTLAEYMGSN